jgi:hypothetical protein
MTPQWRRFALTAHVTASVGWFGAVACFLALAAVGLSSMDAALMRAMYLALDVIGWLVVVPLSQASLGTGIVQAIGTPWGLFRHYWIVIKLVIGIFATIVLILHMEPTGRLAAAVDAATLSDPVLGGLRIQLVADAGAALFVLLVATALAIYKPVGLTSVSPMPRWVKLFGSVVAGLALAFIVAHLSGRGLGGHGSLHG